MDVTDCIGCGAGSSRFRVVVDIDADRELGRLCRTCLTAQFGETVCRAAWRHPDGCAVCDRDAFYALPAVTLCRETRGAGYATSRYEYAVDETTLRLCDEHLTRLSSGDRPVRRAAADGGL